MAVLEKDELLLMEASGIRYQATVLLLKPDAFPHLRFTLSEEPP